MIFLYQNSSPFQSIYTQKLDQHNIQPKYAQEDSEIRNKLNLFVSNHYATKINCRRYNFNFTINNYLYLFYYASIF